MKKAFFCLGVLAAVLGGVQQKTCLVVSRSASLPWSVYLVLKGSSWKKGDIVTFQGHTSPFLKEIPLVTKRIAGVPGDQLVVRKQELYIHNQRVGLVMTHNSTGNPLHPIEKRVIPSNYVFVVGDDPRSFDSRYKEFGLVKTQHILGRSLPLW